MNCMELEKYFGSLIRKKRNEQKITQEQLAELVGISTTYLRGVEHGEHSVNWKSCLNICMALQLDINEIMNKVKAYNDQIYS